MIRRAHEDPTHEAPEEHPFDELGLELSQRKVLIGGIDDIKHKYPDLGQMEKIKCKNEESETETETSDSEQEQEEGQDADEETDNGSASDYQRAEQEKSGEFLKQCIFCDPTPQHPILPKPPPTPLAQGNQLTDTDTQPATQH